MIRNVTSLLRRIELSANVCFHSNNVVVREFDPEDTGTGWARPWEKLPHLPENLRKTVEKSFPGIHLEWTEVVDNRRCHAIGLIVTLDPAHMM